MKKVLIITFYFPPIQNIASIRIKGLAKYLPKYGWEPIILLPKSSFVRPDYQFCKIIETRYQPLMYKAKRYLGFNPDENIAQSLQTVQLSYAKKIILAFVSKLLMEFLAYPDPMKNWFPFAFKEAKKFLQQVKINAIISSSPPATCHIIAHHIKKEMDIPWIADFRDLWTQNHYYSYSPIRKFIEKGLEKKTLSNADALVSVSVPLVEKLKSFHKDKKIYCITNGFDVDELAPTNYPLSPKFTITHTGTLYAGKRDPKLLLEAIHSLIKKGKIIMNEIEIKFYGPKELWLEKEINYYGLNEIVHQYGILPREKIIKEQQEAQLLLLLTWDNPAEYGVYTGKIFEYLAARRPILAIGGSKVVSELLKETKAGFSINNIYELEQFLCNAYNQFKEKGYVSYEGDFNAIAVYTHDKMAEKFASILNQNFSLR